MSGDVQPRKRKDKKKKKDELGLEEPRGTAAVLGEGDVFMHSYHDHGTGGHWCAKIIFFSLLAVLVTLIGLIILENRGLTELEANSVESRYSGVLEGWLEDAPDDDHHDEHTLELKHPDDDTDDHADSEHDGMEEHEIDEDESHEEDDEHDVDEDESHEEDDEHDVDEENEADDEENDEDDDDDNDDENIESNEEGEDDENEENDDETQENLDSREDSNDEEIDEDIAYSQYKYNQEKYSIEENDEYDISKGVEEDNNLSNEIDDNDDQNVNHGSDEEDDEDKDDADDENNKYDEIEQDNSQENNYEETEEQNDDDIEDDEEVEHIEREVDDNEISQEKDVSKEDEAREEEGDEDDEPPIERIATPPAGKPFVEIEEEVTEKSIDTLAEEEEYERRQEELRKEEAQASHVWLKLAVGGALLVATHAVVRRATARRDDPESEEPSREDSPSVTDRRMTIVEEVAADIPQQRSPPPTQRQEIEEEFFKKPYPVTKSAPLQKSDIGPEVKTSDTKKVTEERDEEEKELYSDEEYIEEEEEEEVVLPTKVTPQQKSPEQKSPVIEQKDEESEPEVPDDVEIIDDEQIEEEEEEIDEEEISDVDDTDLLSRLEAKYGRLPEPERPGKHKDGGNSIEDDWPGEPSQAYWREQLDIAEEELRQGDWYSCGKRVEAPALADSARARHLAARSLDLAAEMKKSNYLLSKAISAYLHLLKMNEGLSDKKLVKIASRTINRIQFRGIYLNAEPIYRLLIRRFPTNVEYRNNLTISFLMANRADLADEVLKETLRLWPNDRVALAHYGFVLKNQHNKLEEAVVHLKKALDGDAGKANEARFYYHLGDALLQLGRTDEAHEVHVRGADLGHFLSPHQRSLYNVPRLRSRPWWPVNETPYVELVETLEKSWREILKEGEAAQSLYELEKEGLLEKGGWSQLDVFVQGREVAGRCARAAATCAAVRAEPAARCGRGQVKFSALRAGSHVRAHTGPTNCRLRLHLALSNTAHTYIRVHDEIRQWQVGKAFIFDDSFEHEVWHNGTGTRLVLIVDVWHPDLSVRERLTLPAI